MATFCVGIDSGRRLKTKCVNASELFSRSNDQHVRHSVLVAHIDYALGFTTPEFQDHGGTIAHGFSNTKLALERFNFKFPKSNLMLNPDTEFSHFYSKRI